MSENRAFAHSNEDFLPRRAQRTRRKDRDKERAMEISMVESHSLHFSALSAPSAVKTLRWKTRMSDSVK